MARAAPGSHITDAVAEFSLMTERGRTSSRGSRDTVPRPEPKPKGKRGGGGTRNAHNTAVVDGVTVHTTNRREWPLCVAFQKGECPDDPDPGKRPWCPRNYGQKHQCWKCLRMHPGSQCQLEVREQTPRKGKGKSGGRGKGGHKGRN